MDVAAGDSLFMTSRGRVIGLGRVKIPRMPKLGFDFEIPLLSFIVTERFNGEEYIATCLHMQIDGYGKTIDGAMKSMVDNVWYFLRENFRYEECRDSAWDNLLEAFNHTPKVNLWHTYHALQLDFARRGIPTDRYTEFYKKIQSLEEKVRDLEAAINEKESFISDAIDSFISENTGEMIIEYDERTA
jgi:hypothetical protein